MTAAIAPHTPDPSGGAPLTGGRPAPRAAIEPDDSTPVLDVVVPVYNEERDLGPCVQRLHAHLTDAFPYRFRITVADNASTDKTLAVAKALESQYDEVAVVHLDQKGRGRALRTVWTASDAPVLAYMDVDLSTDLNALLPLVAPLISGHSDLAIGSRLSRTSRVVRGAKREIISRCYNVILRGTLRARFSDAQCGFKAIRADVAERLLPLVQDTAWFFDTELLVLAERSGLRIHEVPVDWVDDPDSRVDVVATAVADLKGVARVGKALATGALPVAQLRRELGREEITGAGADETAGVAPGMTAQIVRFAVIGVISTVAFLLLYSLFRTAMPAQVSNLLALVITAVANTAANRRLTFGIRGKRHAGRSQVEGLVVFGLGLVLTSGSLALLDVLSPGASHVTELVVLVIANAVATLLRFVAYRSWVFHPRRQSA
ncbi:bifunctional glycosyltransferase family 2/GtrA family protein [Actinomycetospora sp. TBRC 11914]|uniref:bifunctional glycosyltransferase family 2/GtrA family protein n=1 Tax=Actinomycetospora sp. TBRC 11914 TaxID=2729387 RepID=UPI00145D3745|nr:bifunctional glycosyltransferase family 2/GtrA family protein [Actinomycetospora sp. TBRC 11914]NMO89263.1 bifunctional glycosyltransferase family 2/GtrA family protein [Actinomycetospora sp. TBRC 11914]